MLRWVKKNKATLMFEHDLEQTDKENSMDEILNEYTVKCYGKITKDQDMSDNVIITPVNGFLSSLSQDEQRILKAAFYGIKMTYLSLRQVPNETLSDGIRNVTRKVKDILGQLDKTIDLCGKISTYVNDRIPINISDDIGKCDQDCPEKTFYRSEVISLTEIALLCKFMAPIFGDFLAVLDKRIHKESRTIFCADFLSSIFAEKYVVVEKLKKYIYLVTKKPDGNINDTYANSNTLELMATRTFGEIMMRKLVLLDLYTEKKNFLMSTVASCVSHPQFSHASEVRYNTIFDPTQTASSSEEGNESMVEKCSRRSNVYSDVPLYAELSMTQLIKRKKKENPRINELVDKMVEYYKAHPIDQNFVTNVLIGLFYGTDIGGATSLKYANIAVYSALMSIVQIELIEMGFYDLAQIISSKSAVKQKKTEVDTGLSIAYGGSVDYQNCLGLFPYAVRDIDIKSVFEAFVKYLIQNVLSVNIPPCVFKAYKLQNTNGNVAEYTEEVMINFAKLINIKIQP